jgi:hypothetical protein
VQMAEHGEWNRRGATLSDVNAEKEYRITRDFIVAGIRAGKLEYREEAVWGNPYLRIIRRQLERYIEETLGRDQFLKKKATTELRAINKELTDIRKRITELEARKAEFERVLKT